MKKPSIGRIIIYNTTENERNALQLLSCNNSKQLPGIIVGKWSDTCINVKVFVDGNHADLWKTSINQGDDAGQWNWPEINETVETINNVVNNIVSDSELKS